MSMYQGFGIIPDENTGKYLTIRGGHASSFEYNVGMALDKLGYEYIFQYEILGGRRLRGGQIIDFFVFTVPLPTPIFVNGEYWHRDKTREFYQKTLVESTMRGKVRPVLVLWGSEVATYELALSILRRKLV